MLYEINYTKEMKIALAKGNTKLGKGVFAFNLLPGDEPISTKDKGVLTNVNGTCHGCCDGCEKYCYAVRDTRRYHNTCIPSLARNTLLMRNDMEGMFTQLGEQLVKRKAKVLRVHSSGEFETYEYLEKMAKLAAKLPNVKMYFYTKRFDFLERYLREHGMFPDNLVANVSEWHGNTKGYKLDGLNVFAYDDGADPEVSKMVHCPAVDKNGKSTGVTCTQCGRCYSGNKGIKTAVYAH